jgi:hypothetical protein
MNDGKDRQDEFGQAEIAATLGSGEFAVKGLALIGGYGKTEVEHLETPSVCGIENDKTERAFPDAVISSTAAAIFFRFSKILFLEVYSLSSINTSVEMPATLA